MQLQRAAEAEAPADESLALYRQIHGDAHPSTAMARGHLAQLLHARGQLDSAIALFREVLPVLDRTLGIEHCNTLHGRVRRRARRAPLSH